MTAVPLAGSWQAPASPDEPWRERNFIAEAADIFARHQAGMARSLQVAIGPSEIGHPCDRHIAFKVGGVPPINVEGLKWAAWLGTAAHNAAEAAMKQENERLGRERYLIEEENEIEPGVVPYAHTDVYDTDMGEVIDWKFPGDSVLEKARSKGPSNLYKVQVQTYAYGWRKRGYKVVSVRLVMLPRATNDIGMGYQWAAPYNEHIATQALGRVATLQAAATIINGGLSVWGEIPADTTDCKFCPWHNRAKTTPEPDAETGCLGWSALRTDLAELGGQRAAKPAGDPVLRLIADAQDPRQLAALWRDVHARGEWTDTHTRAAADRKSELLT